jgi:hypothetical protein
MPAMTRGDEGFAQSMAELSERLRDRMAHRPPADPLTALKRRQAALNAYDRDKRRQLTMIATGVACLAAASAIAWGIVLFAQPDAPAASSAPSDSSAPVQTAAASDPAIASDSSSSSLPASAPPEPTVQGPVMQVSPMPPAESARAPAVNEPVSVEGTTVPAPDPQTADAKPADAKPAESPLPLPPRDIAEAQKLLTEFGFHPGPIDGTAGPRTFEAITRYQEKRGLAQSGTLDRDLLQQLRQDPATKVVAVAQRRRSPAPYAPAQASAPQTAPKANAGIFEPVRLAGQQITTWLGKVFK